MKLTDDIRESLRDKLDGMNKETLARMYKELLQEKKRRTRKKKKAKKNNQ